VVSDGTAPAPLGPSFKKNDPLAAIHARTPSQPLTLCLSLPHPHSHSHPHTLSLSRSLSLSLSDTLTTHTPGGRTPTVKPQAAQP